MRAISRGCSMLAALALLGGVFAAPASATVIGGSSSGYVVSVDLDLDVLSTLELLLGTGVSLTVNADGLVTDAAGTAPAPYAVTDNLADVNASASVLAASIDLTAGGGDDLIVVNAQSDVDGGAGDRSASADASVNNLVLNVGLNVLGIGLIDLLTIDSGSATIASNADVSGDYGALAGSGSSTIEDLTVDLVNPVLSPIDITADVNTPANTQLSPVPSLLSILVNEQVEGGDGVNSRTFATNALHLDLGAGVVVFGDLGILNGGFQEIGLLTGHVIISHSEAELAAEPTAAPVPATLLLVAGGLLGVGRTRGGRRTS